MAEDHVIDDECGDPHELLFNVRRSIRYHNYRRRYFDLCSKVSSFLKVLSGTATLSAVLAKMGSSIVTTVAAIVAALSTLDLIFQTSQSARLHNDLARRFNVLERKLTVESVERMTKKRLAELCAERLEIEADEPQALRNLDTACFNELCRATGELEYQKHLAWYQKGIFAQLLDIRADSVGRELKSKSS
jgi:hypothetical protein